MHSALRSKMNGGVLSRTAACVVMALTSVRAASWQNPSGFDHRAGHARAAHRYMVKRETLIVSRPRDQNELERPAGGKGGQPAASECKWSGRRDKDSERDACERNN